MATYDENNISDDEIFFGKMTIKEVKKHFQADLHRHSTTCNNTEEDNDNKNEDSFKIIDTRSEPDLRISSTFNDSFSSFSDEFKGATSKWNINSTNSSFLEMEKLVSEADMCSTNEQNVLDNTLDAINYILKHSSSTKYNMYHNDIVNINNSACNSLDLHVEELALNAENISLTGEGTKCNVTSNEKVANKITPNHSTEYLSKNGSHNHGSISSPTKNLLKELPVKTGVLLKVKDENFKTPKAVMSIKKSNDLTPNKILSKTFKHVTSPVAAYIKSTTPTLIVKKVNQSKPLREASSIPKLLSTYKTKCNKENDCLPIFAHRSAKHVKVINKPAINQDETSVKSPGKNQIFSSLAKSNVIHKHVQKQKINSIRKCAESGEGSFANITLQQAEESLCTIVSFNSEKKGSKR